MQPILGNGPISLFAGAGIFFFTFSEFMRAAVTIAEIKDPPRNVPLATVVGLAITAVIFLSVGLVTLGILGVQDLAGSDAPVFKAATQVLGAWGGWIVVVAACAAILSVLSGVLAISRLALAMGEEQELPAWFGAIHLHFRTPHHAVVAMGLVIAVLALLFDLRPLILLSNAFALVWFSITNYTALQVSRTDRIIRPLVSWLGLGGCVLLLLTLPLGALITVAVI